MSVVNPEPLVSIITPNYNGQKFIKNTIESYVDSINILRNKIIRNPKTIKIIEKNIRYILT